MRKRLPILILVILAAVGAYPMFRRSSTATQTAVQLLSHRFGALTEISMLPET